MHDPTEGIRREMVEAINSGLVQPEGQTWTTDELTRDFTVQGFLAPFVMVTRKSDGKRGLLQFRHSPRIYFGWEESQ